MIGPNKTYEIMIEEVIKRLTSTRRTFTEEEVLRPIWEATQDDGITLRSDPRFAFAQPRDVQHADQWRLSSHTLANSRLLADLLSGAWNGKDLDGKLAAFDAEDQQHYVFCPLDPRLKMTVRGVLEPAEHEQNKVLPRALKAELDALGPQLLTLWQDAENEPRTVRAITEMLKELGWSEAEKPIAWLFVRSWLVGFPSVLRAGQDYWVPADQLPQDVEHTRLQVAPVRSSPSDESTEEEGDSQSSSISAPLRIIKRTRNKASDESPVQIGGTATATQVTWTTRLRTANVTEGFLHVPASARCAYPPPSPGEKSKTILRAQWFEDDTRFWLWLDRSKHYLYGEGLVDRFGFLETGTILRIQWAPDIIVMQIAGHDEEVQNEETRLADDEIPILRAGVGESYRRSLQAILKDAPGGVTFPELVKALRSRQHHEVHRGTIYATLHKGGFLQHDHRWFAAPNSAESARQLRQAIVDSYLPDRESLAAASQTASNRMRVKAIHGRLQEIVSRLREH